MFSQIVSFISQALHIFADVGSPHLSHSFNTVIIFSTSSVLINEFSMEDLIKAIDISYKNYIELDESCKKPTSYTGGFF